MSEFLKPQPVSQAEISRRQIVSAELEIIADRIEGSGLSSVDLIRQARQEAEARSQRFIQKRRP